MNSLCLWQMSKSRGNVVDPCDRVAAYTADGLRYYLMKDGVAHSDGSVCFISLGTFALQFLLCVQKKFRQHQLQFEE